MAFLSISQIKKKQLFDRMSFMAYTVRIIGGVTHDEKSDSYACKFCWEIGS